jgi:mono/diheme cytochrome c family protein
VPRRLPESALAIPLAFGLAGCGDSVEVPREQPEMRRAAQVFYQRCSGCHSLKLANSFGSANPGNFRSADRTNGPNFNVRRVNRRDALFAIRNGGFAGTVMPANIVTGRQAELLAAFLARYSGRERGGTDVFESGEQAP